MTLNNTQKNHPGLPVEIRFMPLTGSTTPQDVVLASHFMLKIFWKNYMVDFLVLTKNFTNTRIAPRLTKDYQGLTRIQDGAGPVWQLGVCGSSQWETSTEICQPIGRQH